MKLDEITNEAPVSGIKQAAQGIGSKVLNKIPGAKNKAANLAGKADLSATANNLYKSFNSYLGTQGKDAKTASGDDLAAFLKTRDVALDIPQGVLNKNQINSILMQAAKDMLAKSQNVQPAGQGDSSAPKSDNAKIIGSLPKDLKDRLSALTTQQRQELLKLL